VVARIRRVLGIRSVGHAGTLDPFATGLLVVLVDRATRLARFVERMPKSYRAVARLGQATDTDDPTGQVIARHAPDAWPDQPVVRAALESMVGTQTQHPPAYSARRVDGRRGYELARAGQAVELPAREVTVHQVELLRWDPPEIEFRAVVSAGTYIRAMARDLGERLGTVAHCTALRREWIGPFRTDDALAPEAITRATPLLPPLQLVGDMLRVELDESQAGRIGKGRSIPAQSGPEREAALVHRDRLVAVAERADDAWQPRVVLEAR
jgi:tRNA pseudouridine55 synthase